MTSYPLAFSHGYPIMFHEMDNENNFLDPTQQFILLSDMHDLAPKIASILKKKDLLKDSIVIAAGDMAGTGKLGSDGDPIGVYSVLRDEAQALYFVQGNHDYFNPEAERLTNKDGSFCSLDRCVVELGSGLVLGGVHGIIGKDKPEVHKFLPGTYRSYLKQVLKRGPDVLVTHDTPKTIDHRILYGKTKPKIHLFGHSHYDEMIFEQEGVLSVNLDGRVLLLHKQE